MLLTVIRRKAPSAMAIAKSLLTVACASLTNGEDFQSDKLLLGREGNKTACDRLQRDRLAPTLVPSWEGTVDEAKRRIDRLLAA
jgi:hypothetical protein